jgi:N-acetylmuramic acid 6-phosphate (MurNAc-6-P) etherase
VNPLIGPEPIKGSTRMKGGSATQILLDVAMNKVIDENIYEKDFEKIINEYRKVHNIVKSKIDELATIAMSAKNSFVNGSHIYYMSEGLIGKLAATDAAECTPTYGVRFEDVRAFIKEGWHKLITLDQVNNTNSQFIQEHELDIADFVKFNLTSEDTVIAIYSSKMSKELKNARKYATKKGSKVYTIGINNFDENINGQINKNENKNSNEQIIYFNFKSDEFPNYFGFDRAMTKWVLNLITTEAFVLAGKTWQNTMIDLKLSNAKLVDRAINRVIMPFMNSVNKTFDYSRIQQELNKNAGYCLGMNDNYEFSPSEYISVSKLVPITLLTLSGISTKEAIEYLNKETVVSKVLQKYVL